MKDWKHKDIWSLRESSFLVQVSRHEEADYHGQGKNRWAVYAYIYPEHPKFKEFSGGNMWQAATYDLPFHCGCSFIQYHRDEEGVTSVQVGADYHHLYDDHFTHYADRDDAYEVFRDAERLHDYLKNYTVQSVIEKANKILEEGE